MDSIGIRRSAPRDSVRRRSAALTVAMLATGCASYSSTTTGPAPAKCQVSLSTSMSIVDASGGTGNVTVTTEQECAWSVTADPGYHGS